MIGGLVGKLGGGEMMKLFIGTCEVGIWSTEDRSGCQVRQPKRRRAWVKLRSHFYIVSAEGEASINYSE